MNAHWAIAFRVGLGIGWLVTTAESAGISGVTRRTAMGGIPGAGAAPAAGQGTPGPNGVEAWSPQQAAAAAMFFQSQGQAPIGAGAGAGGGGGVQGGGSTGSPNGQPVAGQPGMTSPARVQWVRAGAYPPAVTRPDRPVAAAVIKTNSAARSALVPYAK